MIFFTHVTDSFANRFTFRKDGWHSMESVRRTDNLWQTVTQMDLWILCKDSKGLTLLDQNLNDSISYLTGDMQLDAIKGKLGRPTSPKLCTVR